MREKSAGVSCQRAAAADEQTDWHGAWENLLGYRVSLCFGTSSGVGLYLFNFALVWCVPAGEKSPPEVSK